MAATAPAADHLRDDEGPLHVMVETVQCALSGCVPCCAKVLINQGASTSLPNARPETCFRLVRAANSTKKPRVTSIGLYRQGQSILTVGDGDFSFSLALARALKGARVVATSYESHASLAKVYGTACIDTLRELEQLGAIVAHGVDAAELGTTLPAGAVPADGFHRIVWNFPCVARSADGAVMPGAGAGADARGSVEIEANRRLVARFCTGGAALLAARGELHITHKVGLQQWHIEQQGLQQEGQHAAWAAAAGAGAAGLLGYAGAVAFDRAAYPPYRPRKALTAKGFPTTDARTFVFARCGTARGGGGGAAACGATLADTALVQQLSAQVVQAVCSRHGLAPARAAAPAAPAAAPAAPATPTGSCDEGADRRARDRAEPGLRKRSADQALASDSSAAPAAACTGAAPAAASSQKKKKKKKKEKKRSASASLVDVDVHVGAAGVGVRRGACVGAVD